MSVTNEQLLTAARAALYKRLNGDAYNEYETEDQRFKGMDVGDLMALVERLESKVGGDGNTFIEAIG